MTWTSGTAMATVCAAALLASPALTSIVAAGGAEAWTAAGGGRRLLEVEITMGAWQRAGLGFPHPR